MYNFQERNRLQQTFTQKKKKKNNNNNNFDNVRITVIWLNLSFPISLNFETCLHSTLLNVDLGPT